MSTISRTIRNLRRVGLRDAAHQMQYIGDTKAGKLIGTDVLGNKYYENLEEELPLRTRWVDYAASEYNPDQIPPGWHAWMSYQVDKPPVEDALLQRRQRVWEPATHNPSFTQSRGAFKTYSTTKPKFSAWAPIAKVRASGGNSSSGGESYIKG